MKVLLLCICVTGFCTGISIIPDVIKDGLFDVHKTFAETTRDVKYDPVTADKVTYYLFKKENPNEYFKLDVNKLEKLANNDVKIVFLIHGWTNHRGVQWYEDVKNSFLTRDEEWYVVQIDWKDPASAAYTVASISTYDVAKHISDVIVDLVNNYGIKTDNILIVGHSLGGQISGFIGKLIQKKLGKQLPRLIALDPAGPLFNTRPSDKRLNKTDAEIVQVIHTDGGTLGYYNSIGTIDFYPNGGSSQPGCKQIDLYDISTVTAPVWCDHKRAWEYFAEAILNPNQFIAKKCSSWSAFKNDKCDAETVDLGDVTTTLTGDFYLETNKAKPYAKKSSNVGLNILKIFNK